MKLAIILAVSAAAVTVTAAPAAASHKGWERGEGMRHGEGMYRGHRMAMTCVKWKHGRCVVSKRMGHAYAYGRHRRAADYRVGYRFAPNYGYTAYNQIPSNYVDQYHLSPDGRYVYRNNYIYVVNPRTSAVERVLYAITH